MLDRLRKLAADLFSAPAPKASPRKVVPDGRVVRATYDAARDSDEYANAWANADQFDADSAHSKAVRHKLIHRSRYETGSNGFSDGIAQTYATDLIGKGPALRMQTGSRGFNQLVENTWFFWCKATKFRRKLLCMAHAKHVDGETFATLRRNPGLKHEIKLDLVLHEAEQIQTPYIPFAEPGYIDGIKFDEFGNPLWYDVLREHPGTSHVLGLDLVPERVPANRVLHWFKLRRPGQHRAVPECASTLNTGIASRRFREATLAAAETAADFALWVQTTQQPDAADEIRPFETWEIAKRLMNFLPAGWGANQLKAEHPNATYESFVKSLISEQARPKCMSFNRAACDSSGSNYASGKLDYMPYFSVIDDVDREDCNDLVLDPLFDVWFDTAVVTFGWLGGDPLAISPYAKAHIWDWPQHDAADIQTEATANRTQLSSGEISLSELYSKSGRDFDDALPKMAADYGVTEDEMRKILRTAIFNEKNQQASMQSAETQQQTASKPEPKDDPVAAMLAATRLTGAANGHAHQ